MPQNGHGNGDGQAGAGPDLAPVGPTDTFITLVCNVFEEEGKWIAEATQIDLSAFGDTEDEAREALDKALDVYIDLLISEGAFERVMREKQVPLFKLPAASGSTHVAPISKKIPAGAA
ncbi:MAG: hypothetical protein WEB00_06090 [Dehalococcoidia bacterium]